MTYRPSTNAGHDDATERDDARAAFDRALDDTLAVALGPDDCADAFLCHVSEAYATDGRNPADWTDDEMADTYDDLARYVATEDGAFTEPERRRDRLAATFRAHAGALRSAAEADAMEAEAYTVEPYADLGGISPAQARAEAISDDAEHVLSHLIAVGVTFDARRKVAQAEEFTFLQGGAALAVPSKLERVTPFQGDLSRLAETMDAMGPAPTGTRYYPARLHKGTDGDGRPVVIVMAETTKGRPESLRAVGFLQRKHVDWIAPILRTAGSGAVTETSTPIRVYVTAVTGGTPDRPTRGCNVVIAGAADAVRADVRARAEEARQAAAYESGSVVAVEAATE